MYVPSLKNNLVSIYALEDKGMKVFFINGKVLTWPLISIMRESFTLRSGCEGIYQVNGKPIHALVHDTYFQCELWHKIFAHLHYKALPHVRKMFSGMLEIRMDHEGFFPRMCKWKAYKGTIPFKQNKS